MVQGLLRLEADPPRYDGGTPSLDVITAVVALDYVDFRFPKAAWLPELPALRKLVARTASRASFEVSRPR
jgi:glutathione S-transferase